MSSKPLVAVLRGELVKAWTVRSTGWCVLLTFLVSIGLGLVDSWSVRAAIARHSPLVRSDFDPADAGFVGISYGQVCLVVFAVLFMASEYTTGSIRSSLAAVPRRGLFLAGKLLALTVIAFAVSLTAALTSFAASERELGPMAVPLGSDGVPRAILGAAGYVTLVCVLSAAVAGLLRSSAMALGTLIPFYLVIPTIISTIPGVRAAANYLPDQAGAQAMQIAKQGTSTLTPVSGMLVLAAWTACAVLSGYVSLRVRDA
ncbi:MAG TPA: hypothetical protein VGX23_07670 [Actinocrinis sp.]|nr:hypothetical protein [Actinocrinis sp.]